MLEKFLGNEQELKTRFISNATPISSKMFSLFKVDQSDLDKHIEAAKPFRRKQSGQDPFYKKLEYRKFYPQVKRTE
jgi:hypothetical protein